MSFLLQNDILKNVTLLDSIDFWTFLKLSSFALDRRNIHIEVLKDIRVNK